MAMYVMDKIIENLNKDVIKLGNKIIQVLEKAKYALINLDVCKASEIIKNDKKIDLFEMNVHEKGMNIIIREQPVAGDLRFIISVFKIVSEMERIADHGDKIAKLTKKLVKHNVKHLPKEINDLFNLTLEIVRNVLKAYIEGDVNLAKKIYIEDDILDQSYKNSVIWIKESIIKNPNFVDKYIDYIFITKYFERIGDRANAIAKQIVYKETGSFFNLE